MFVRRAGRRRIKDAQNATLAYDQENRLTTVSGGASASYLYDGDGVRVRETTSGVTRIFIAPTSWATIFELQGATIKK